MVFYGKSFPEATGEAFEEYNSQKDSSYLSEKVVSKLGVPTEKGTKRLFRVIIPEGNLFLFSGVLRWETDFWRLVVCVDRRGS